MQFSRAFPLLFAAAAAFAPLHAQQEGRPIADLAKAEQELARMFDRPAGTRIGDEQKDKLRRWLADKAGQDLQQLGYAPALLAYLDADYAAAGAALDQFLSRYPTIGNEEHRNMAGRIYANAISTGARSSAPDHAKLALQTQRMTDLFGNTEMLGRLGTALEKQVAKPTEFRLALSSGVLQSKLDAAAKEAFLQRLYGATGAPTSGPETVRAMRMQPLADGDAATKPKGNFVEPGQPMPAIPVEALVNGPKDMDPATWSLAAYRDKVLVLDFFATWCGPCRAVTPELVELQQQFPKDVQVLAITRFYGNGMDFSDPEATLPHGGKSVRNLDRADELRINEAFVKAFSVPYPVVFTGPTVAKEQFGVTGIPTVYVIGKDGKVVGNVVGGGEPNKKRLLELVEQARR
jgi:thiol-disulfide isomerase/thioredoxin